LTYALWAFGSALFNGFDKAANSAKISDALPNGLGVGVDSQ
jgi:hypothetical protein